MAAAAAAPPGAAGGRRNWPFACECVRDDVPVSITENLRFGVFGVPRGSPAFDEIARSVATSLPDAEVVHVQRVFNGTLWPAFCVQRDLVAASNEGDANMKLMFHVASRENLSQILGSTIDAGSNASGFNPNFSGSCAYSSKGCGCYFAEHAAYPVRIHPREFDEERGTFTLVVAVVICGRVKDMGAEVRSFVTAPKAPGAGDYDSVSGTELGIGYRHIPQGRAEFGRQSIVYRPDRAYPMFVVTIRPPTVPLGVPLALMSSHHMTNLVNPGAPEDGTPQAKAADAAPRVPTPVCEQVVLVQSPKNPNCVGIMSVKHAPYTFLRVADGDGHCFFDRIECRGDEQWSIEQRGYEIFFVSRKNGRTLSCVGNKTVLTLNDGRDLWESWRPTFDPAMRPLGPGVHLGTTIFLRNRRLGTFVMNRGSAEDNTPQAGANEKHMRLWEELMIVRAPADPRYFGIMSLRYAPHTFLRASGDGRCFFDRHECRRDEQWSIEQRGGALAFVSRTDGHRLHCVDDDGCVLLRTEGREDADSWELVVQGADGSV
mmetsp:Transcript_21647/g.56491  ORF Transcript_21647/g.56491 Transcript_21647/m.56491 type:complete len:543 (+) Transcript_21647:215-1843(+)